MGSLFLVTHQNHIVHIISFFGRLRRQGEREKARTPRAPQGDGCPLDPCLRRLFNRPACAIEFVSKSAVCYYDHIEAVIFIKQRTVMYGFAWKACPGDGPGPARVGYGRGTLCSPTGGCCACDRYESARDTGSKRSRPGRLANRICAW